MPVYRGPDLTAEQIEAAVREAAAAMAECKTIAELRGVWRHAVTAVGHRALGRLFVAECKNVDKIAERKASMAK